MSDYLRLLNGRPVLTTAPTTSTGVPDAGKIPKLDAAGKLDMSMMPNGLGADAVTRTAAEAIAARDLVSFTSTGQIQKADASNDRAAVGFVTAAIASGATGTVFFEGTITGLSGLTPGARYFLSATAAGTFTLTPVTAGAGRISQEVGFAISTTELTFEPQPAILLG